MRTLQKIEELAWDRLSDANVLFVGQKFDAAFYLAGYAVELMLKFRICTIFGIPNLFDETDQDANAVAGISEMRKAVKTYNLHALLAFSGLREKFNAKREIDSRFQTVSAEIFLEWSEQCRYNEPGTVKPKIIGLILNALGTKTEGVLQWLCEEK